LFEDGVDAAGAESMALEVGDHLLLTALPLEHPLGKHARGYVLDA
jgi:hypothetical protein